MNTICQSPRQKALANNDITYFTGKPCKKGHLSVRFTLTGNCKECQQEFAKVNQTRYHLKKNFDLTEREYNLILEHQNGVCAICKDVETVIDGQSKKVKPLSVDHDHKTGKVRGLLCTKCNVGLGAFNDEMCVLLNAVEYLKKHE